MEKLVVATTMPDEPEEGASAEGSEQQTPPQIIQFQIPVQQPLQGRAVVQEGAGTQPQIIVQNASPQQQSQAIQQPLPNVVNLIDNMTDATKEGNKSEAQVSSQIILIASAIIAIVGVFALNTDSKSSQHFSWQVGTLLIVAIAGLGTALAAGVMHFVLERRFWYGNRQKSMDAIGLLAAISNPEDRNNAAAAATNQMKPGSNRIAFYLQVISFFIGVLALLILVVSEIVAKVHG